MILYYGTILYYTKTYIALNIILHEDILWRITVYIFTNISLSNTLIINHQIIMSELYYTPHV